MSLRSRISIYVWSAVIGGVCGFLFPFLLFGLIRIIPGTIPEKLFESVLYASAPAFTFGDALGARMLDLLVLVICYWMFVGMVAAFGTVWLYFRLLHKTGGRLRDWLTVALVLGVLLSSAIVWKATRDYRVFRKYVLKPIPKSVEQIRMHRRWEASGHAYVMRFKISKVDVELLVNSRQFEEFDQVDYHDGSLSWRRTDPPRDMEGLSQTDVLDRQMRLVEDMSLYPPYHGEHSPQWFRPNEWNSPKVYRFYERRGRSERSHEQVLIYNEELSESYFVEYLSGTW